MTVQHTPGAGIIVGLLLGAVLWCGIIWATVGLKWR